MPEPDPNSAEGFPYEAVMDLYRLCRDDPRLERAVVNSRYRRKLIQGHIEDVSRYYEIDAKKLAHVTALMIEHKSVEPAFA